MKFIKLLLFLFCFSALTGCASIVSGTHETVSVVTPPTKNAYCNLKNNQGEWFLKHTPGSVRIHRAYGALHVACRKRGYHAAHQLVESNIKPIVFGNVVFGGPIGAGIDVADGAAFHYPKTIIVPMHKKG